MKFDRSLDAPYGQEVRLSPLVTRLLADNPGPYTFRGTGVYIVGGAAKVAVIDPGPAQPDHLAALKRALGGRKVSHILITHTHADHSPAAAELKAWSGAKTYAFGPHAVTGSAEEAVDLAFAPDMLVKDGDVIAGDGFTITGVHTPGHTSNHMCYALAEEAALFSGDTVMGWSTSVVAPPDGDMGDYLDSLEKLRAREERIFYPTHGSPITDPQGWLDQLIAHRRMREAQVVASMAGGANTVAALVAAIYPGLEAGLQAAAAAQVQAHLDYLVRQGRVATNGDGFRLTERAPGQRMP
ncbi:MAG TPA: MBL fold metallo-hydrolase [Rhizomicrobium sp.]|jgi:glyoxylase-like metal-dependent hydrolase (beta-lactamase superfamily II)